MREYESIFVLNPNLDDSQVDTELEKIREFLTGKDSEIIEVQKWGRRKLAYEVAKNREGVYTLIRFSAGAEIPKELDRRDRLNENMLRFLTVIYERAPIEESAPEGAEETASKGADARPGGQSDGDVGSVNPEPTKKETPDEAPIKKEALAEESTKEETSGEESAV